MEPKVDPLSVVLGMPELKKFCYIGLSHPRKQMELMTILKRGAEYLNIRVREDVNDINPILLKIYKSLRVDKNYRIRIHYRNLSKEGITRDKIKETVKDLFGYDLKTTTKGLMYFKSKKVYDYVANY